MRENDNDGLGCGSNIDFASILLEVEPGYIAIQHPDGHQQILLTQPMEITPGVKASVGFELDGADGVLGEPVFLHRRMQIRHLGSLEEYCADPFVRSQLPQVVRFLDPALGALPVIAVIEALRVDPSAEVQALVSAILERRRSLWLAAEQV